MYRSLTTVLLWTAFGAAACGPDADAETTAEGSAIYDDAETTADGSDSEPASPEPGTSMTVDLEVDGTGDLDVGDPSCALDGNSFDALYEGEGETTGDGVYLASFAAADATFETPSGCEIPDAEVNVVTGVSVVARIENTSQQCETYCQAKARSYAETECEGDADEASCRGEAETTYEGSCTTTCEDPETRFIVARTELGAGAVANLAVSELSGKALGTIEADLTFDRLEDQDGNRLEEGPE